MVPQSGLEIFPGRRRDFPALALHVPTIHLLRDPEESTNELRQIDSPVSVGVQFREYVLSLRRRDKELWADLDKLVFFNPSRIIHITSVKERAETLPVRTHGW